MLMIEDVLESVVLTNLAKFPEGWTQNFLLNVATFVSRGTPLSTAQADTVVKIFRSNLDVIIECGFSRDEINTLLLVPRYRIPLYQSVKIPREVRYVGNNLIAFRFKRDDVALGDLLKIAQKTWSTMGYFPEERIRTVFVNQDNVNDVFHFIDRHRFMANQEVIDFLQSLETRFPQAVLDRKNDQIIFDPAGDELLCDWASEYFQKDTSGLNARLLHRMSKIFDFPVNGDLIALSHEGRLQWDLPPRMAEIAQTIQDYDFGCQIATPFGNELIPVIHSLRTKNPEKRFFSLCEPWLNRIDYGEGIEHLTIEFDNLRDLASVPRDAVVITSSHSMKTILQREFKRCLLIYDISAPQIFQMLIPSKKRQVKDFRDYTRILESKGVIMDLISKGYLREENTTRNQGSGEC